MDAEARPVRAKVTLVEPIYETVVVSEPYTTCRRDYVERRVSSPNVAGQTLAGAIVGAAIGRQFGDGNGRDALTVLGAVAGSAVANERAQRRQGNTVTVVREPVESCTTEYRRHAERRLTGYWVEYRHRGRTYRIVSRERPGREILVEHRS
jgi:uncharacterized protein YcfJ